MIKTVLPRAVCFARPLKENRPQDDGFNTYQKPPPRWIMDEVSELGRLERTQAREKQFIAEIKNPLKTGFRRNSDSELDAAFETLWHSGPRSRDLYVKIGKGLATMTREDLFCLLAEPLERIETLASALTAGMTLQQAIASISCTLPK